MEQYIDPQATQVKEPIDIFDEVAEQQAEEHRKVIKSARKILFVIAALQLVFSVVITFTKDEDDGGVELIFGSVVASIYVGLGFWARKKPYIALIVSLVLYSLLIVLGAINDPATLAKGMIMRVVIIIALVKGIRKAKSLEELESIRNIE